MPKFEWYRGNYRPFGHIKKNKHNFVKPIEKQREEIIERVLNNLGIDRNETIVGERDEN